MKTLSREPWRGGQICGYQTAYGLPWSVFCGELKKPGSPVCDKHDAELREDNYGSLPKFAEGNALGLAEYRRTTMPYMFQLAWEPMDTPEDPHGETPIPATEEEVKAWQNSEAGVRVHEYNTSAYAYDETQTNDAIRDGDVIIAKEEGAIAILDRAWPFAVTLEHGEFHGPPVMSAHLFRGGFFIESLAVALDKARELGFPVSPLNAPVITAVPEQDPVRGPEYPCPSCEGYGDIPIHDASTDAIVGWRQCPDRRNHPVSLVKPAKPLPVSHLEGCDGASNVRYDCCPPF